MGFVLTAQGKANPGAAIVSLSSFLSSSPHQLYAHWDVPFYMESWDGLDWKKSSWENPRLPFQPDLGQLNTNIALTKIPAHTELPDHLPWVFPWEIWAPGGISAGIPGSGQVVPRRTPGEGNDGELGWCWVLSVPIQDSFCWRQARLETMGISGSRALPG